MYPSLRMLSISWWVHRLVLELLNCALCCNPGELGQTRMAPLLKANQDHQAKQLTLGSQLIQDPPANLGIGPVTLGFADSSHTMARVTSQAPKLGGAHTVSSPGSHPARLADSLPFYRPETRARRVEIRTGSWGSFPPTCSPLTNLRWMAGPQQGDLKSGKTQSGETSLNGAFCKWGSLGQYDIQLLGRRGWEGLYKISGQVWDDPEQVWETPGIFTCLTSISPPCP